MNHVDITDLIVLPISCQCKIWMRRDSNVWERQCCGFARRWNRIFPVWYACRRKDCSQVKLWADRNETPAHSHVLKNDVQQRMPFVSQIVFTMSKLGCWGNFVTRSACLFVVLFCQQCRSICYWKRESDFSISSRNYCTYSQSHVMKNFLNSIFTKQHLNELTAQHFSLQKVHLNWTPNIVAKRPDRR